MGILRKVNACFSFDTGVKSSIFYESILILPTSTSISDEIYQQGFHLIDGFLEPCHYLALKQIIRHLHHQGSFTPAQVGQKQEKTHNPLIRSDSIFWLDKYQTTLAVEELINKINELRTILNQSLYLGLIDYEAHFAVYQANSFYKKHVDQFSTNKDRRISCVYYLNDHWPEEFGGELKLYDKTDHLLTKIMPLGNRFICFNSDLPHEVCTAYQTRYSIAAWLKIRSLS